MSALGLKITLLSDVVLTERSATVGGCGSLDSLPGAVLLGVAAKRLYPSLHEADPDTAFALFHSGGVRFGDALPEGPDGAVGLPVPLSFHTVKGSSESSLWLNRARGTGEGQLKQVRLGRLAGNAHWIPERRASMRTAIDPRGRAREGLLYGYDALVAGLVFRARVDAVDAALLKRVRAALLQDGGEASIGRSRTAEFGRIRIEEAPLADLPSLSVPAQQGRVLLLCVSDLCLRDAATGQPTLDPDPSDFGFPPTWSLDRTTTFLRSRRYTPFNGHRRRPDLERQVLVAGSVLAFQGTGDIMLADLRQRCASGVGEHLEHGLGSVLVEPEVLRPSQLQVETWRPTREERPFAAIANDPLLGWLTARADEGARRDRLWKQADDFARDLARVGLPRSQWGLVQSLAREARHREKGGTWLRQELEARIQHAPSRHKGAGTEKAQGDPEKKVLGAGVRSLVTHWGRKDHRGQSVATRLLSWIDQFLSEKKGENKEREGLAELPTLLELLATRALRHQERETQASDTAGALHD